MKRPGDTFKKQSLAELCEAADVAAWLLQRAANGELTPTKYIREHYRDVAQELRKARAFVHEQYGVTKVNR